MPADCRDSQSDRFLVRAHEHTVLIRDAVSTSAALVLLLVIGRPSSSGNQRWGFPRARRSSRGRVGWRRRRRCPHGRPRSSPTHALGWIRGCGWWSTLQLCGCQRCHRPIVASAHRGGCRGTGKGGYLWHPLPFIARLCLIGVDGPARSPRYLVPDRLVQASDRSSALSHAL